tara:strand:- start:21 stop:233 length:213 start_codon:yes stop_codon:yes gene_type:complete
MSCKCKDKEVKALEEIISIQNKSIKILTGMMGQLESQMIGTNLSLLLQTEKIKELRDTINNKNNIKGGGQ